MEYPKLLAALQANVDTSWREIEIGDFDQLLAELERGDGSPPPSVNPCSWNSPFRRFPLYETDREAGNASPLRP